MPFACALRPQPAPAPFACALRLQPATDAGAEVGDVLDISWADIRVGKIVDAVPHPESDKLYVETIDLGDESPRQILSASDNLPECMLIASLIR